MIERFLELEQRIVKPYGFKRFVWRLFGRIGHAFFSFYPPEVISSSGKKLLNLGAGTSLQNDFVNADFYRLHHLLKRSSADWMLDITKPLKCKDNYWDGVYLSHVNEHITFSANYNLLMAACLIAIFPVITLYFFTQKLFLESISNFGLKQ